MSTVLSGSFSWIKKRTKEAQSDREKKKQQKVRQQLAVFSTFKVDFYPTAFAGELVEEYNIPRDAHQQESVPHVIIANERGKGKYIISEPILNDVEQRNYGLLMEDLYTSMRAAVDGGGASTPVLASCTQTKHTFSLKRDERKPCPEVSSSKTPNL